MASEATGTPSTGSSPFYVIADQEEVTLLPGVTAHLIAGERGMLMFVRFAPGVAIPEHDHPHEQLGTCLEGDLYLTINGEEQVIRSGQAYVIPGGVRHAARAAEDGQGFLALDVFAPPREDYLAKLTRR